MRENYNKMMNEKCQTFDKILKTIQTNKDFCVGNELTFVDIQLVSLYIFSKDVNVGHDFEKASPLTFKVNYFQSKVATVFQTAMNIINNNPKIKEFVDEFQASGKPCTGLGKMY